MMKRLTTSIVITLGLGLAALPAAAQAPHSGHGAHAAAPRHAPDVCEREFEQVVADGRGFGMAFAADRHGYPGPLHVLELASQLGLSADQETRVRALMDAMFAESRPKGALLLAAERRLTSLFASGRADLESVRAAVGDVERLRAELRTLHLVTHLRTRELLSDAQRRAYHVARWGAH
jgi:Spy/CpxP family protein refolding chaperone